MKTKTIFRDEKTKQTAAEKYAAALGLQCREVWRKKHGLSLQQLPECCDEIYLEVEGKMITKTMLAKFEGAGLRLIQERNNWGAREYLFAQRDEQNKEMIGNVTLTHYKGAGFAITLHNQFVHGEHGWQ